MFKKLLFILGLVFGFIIGYEYGIQDGFNQGTTVGKTRALIEEGYDLEDVYDRLSDDETMAE